MKALKITLVVFAVLALGTGCKKIIKALLQTFTFNAPVTVSIPIITAGSSADTVWMPTLDVNVDSIIKAQTGNQFNLDLVDDVQVEDMQLTLTNADANNNLANFQQVSMLMQTNTGGSWTNTQYLANNTIPDVYATDLDVNMVSPISLLSSLKNNQIRFGAAMTIRRSTTQAIDGTLNLTLRVK